MPRLRFRISTVIAVTFAVAFFLSLARMAAMDKTQFSIAVDLFGVAPLLCFCAAGLFSKNSWQFVLALTLTAPILFLSAVLYSYGVGGRSGPIPTIVTTCIIWLIQYAVIGALVWWWNSKERT